MFIYQFQILFHQVDHAGVLFFSNLFTHAHDAYEYFMAHLGLPLECFGQNQSYILPIVHAEADYQAPFRHGMKIEVAVTVSRLGKTSFTTAYTFVDANSQQLARLHLVHCCVDVQTGKTRSLPEQLHTLLQSH